MAIGLATIMCLTSLNSSLLSSLFPPSQGNLSSDSVILEGQVTRGHFGTSVTNLGDIDDDGYEGVCMRCDCASEAVTVCVKL